MARLKSAGDTNKNPRLDAFPPAHPLSRTTIRSPPDGSQIQISRRINQARLHVSSQSIDSFPDHHGMTKGTKPVAHLSILSLDYSLQYMIILPTYVASKIRSNESARWFLGPWDLVRILLTVSPGVSTRPAAVLIFEDIPIPTLSTMTTAGLLVISSDGYSTYSTLNYR